MPAVVQPAHAVGWPGNDMGYAGRHLLLATRTAEGPVGAGTTDAADKPLAVAVGFAPFDPTDGSVQVQLSTLVASAMGAGHAPIIRARSG